MSQRFQARYATREPLPELAVCEVRADGLGYDIAFFVHERDRQAFLRLKNRRRNRQSAIGNRQSP